MRQVDEQELSKKELILKVTLGLLESEGFKGVTIRKIAEAADVNVALVNYHFGSKNKLINEVIQILVDSLKELFVILDDDSIEPKMRLKRFLIQYVNIYHQYPFIARHILDQDAVIFDSQKEFVVFMKAIGLKKMQRTIEQLTGETDPEKLTIMMTHLLGSTFLPALIEPLYEKVTGFPLPDRETRIGLMLDRYFSESK